MPTAIPRQPINRKMVTKSVVAGAGILAAWAAAASAISASAMIYYEIYASANVQNVQNIWTPIMEGTAFGAYAGAFGAAVESAVRLRFTKNHETSKLITNVSALVMSVASAPLIALLMQATLPGAHASADMTPQPARATADAKLGAQRLTHMAHAAGLHLG